MTDFRNLFKEEHAVWTAKLSDYFNNPDGSFTVELALDDKACPLGQWIYGEGEQYSSLPEFITCKKLHVDYHKLSGEIVSKLNNGEILDKKQTIGMDSRFDQLALELSSSIITLQRKIDSLNKGNSNSGNPFPR
jgi:methyl-accepting chemotaxis protein